MILNEDVRFEGVAQQVKRAFLRTPEKVLLGPSVQLYKWTGWPLFDGSRITPWWSFVQTTLLPSGLLADGFRTSEERAARLGKPHRTFARVRAAVSGQFGNTMENLLVVRINLPVWGFAGQASGQREFADDRADLQHVYLIGGAHQLWVPNLTSQYVTAVPILGS